MLSSYYPPWEPEISELNIQRETYAQKPTYIWQIYPIWPSQHANKFMSVNTAYMEW
jgi:hypothetical protein